MSDGTLPAPSRFRIASLAPEFAILVLTAVVVLAGLGVRGLWRQENRWGEISREMMLGRDYFHPTIGGDPYDDKPMTSYWPVVLAARLGGRLDEFAVRLPSAIAGFVLVACTLWLGRMLWSPFTGRLAALMVVSCHGFLQWSRTGMPEMENAAAVLLAICWYWAWRDRPGFVAFVGFYLIVFIGALLKGLPAVVLPIIAIVPDLLSGNRWRRLLTPGHAVAVCIGVAVYLAPFVYGSRTSHDGINVSSIGLVFRENILRFIRPFDHDTSPFYLYLYFLPFFFLPWAPLLVAAIVGFVAGRRELEPHSRWLAVASALILAFFSISGSRRSYYIIPLLPFCALMVAVFVARLDLPRLDRFRRAAIAFQVAVVIGGIIVQLAGPLIAGPVASRWNVTIPPDIIRSMRLIGLAAIVVWGVGYALAYIYVRRDAMIVSASLAALVLMGGFATWQLNLFDAFRHDREFVQAVRARSAGFGPNAVAFYRTNSDALLFYLDRPAPPPILMTDQTLKTFFAKPGPHAVVTRRAFAADIASLKGPPNLEEPHAPWAVAPDPDGLVAWIDE